MRTVGLGVLTLGVVWLLVVALAWGFQRHLIYLPDRGEASPPDGVETLEFVTDDGLGLEAWRVPATASSPVSTVLVTPGNAGNRALRLPLARGLAERGHDVVLLDYRGYGGNPGSPSEEGLVADARALRAHLVDGGVEPGRLVYLGESIGSAVAAALAAHEPPGALALRSPFPQLSDVAATHYPFLPVRTLLRERHPTLEHLERVDAPLLVVAGGADGIVPTDLSRRVARATDATYVEVEDADHNDAALLDGPDYLDAVDEFVRAAVG